MEGGPWQVAIIGLGTAVTQLDTSVNIAFPAITGNSASRFRNELEDYMSEDYADETLKTVVSWGRCAELFAYDEQSDQHRKPRLDGHA
jgi:hypothetical protein